MDVILTTSGAISDEKFFKLSNSCCIDIERASKTRFDSQVLDTVMGMPNRACVTNYIILFYAIQLLMHVSVSSTNFFY